MHPTARLLPFLLLLTPFFLHACSRTIDSPLETTIEGRPFQLELALDPRTRARGLMYRTDIPDDRGMLFVYPSPRPVHFYMKNCLMDIDLAFLDAQGRVLGMHRMKAETPQGPNESDAAYERRLKHYASGVPIQLVLELGAGQLDRLGLAPGSRLSLPVERLIEAAR